MTPSDFPDRLAQDAEANPSAMLPLTQARLEKARKLVEGVSDEKPPFKLNVDPSWILWMAEKEDGCIVSVGGLAVRLADS